MLKYCNGFKRDLEIDKFHSYKKSACKDCIYKKVMCDYCGEKFNSTNLTKHIKLRHNSTCNISQRHQEPYSSTSNINQRQQKTDITSTSTYNINRRKQKNDDSTSIIKRIDQENYSST